MFLLEYTTEATRRQYIGRTGYARQDCRCLHCGDGIVEGTVCTLLQDQAGTPGAIHLHCGKQCLTILRELNELPQGWSQKG